MLTLNHLVTSGTFSLDGGTWDVDNNVWVLGDDAECVVIDAPHDADAILAAVAPRRLTAILCTHAHDDHIDAAAALADATHAPIWLHPADRELWDRTPQGPALPDRDLADGQRITVAGAELTVLHTPGHSRGAVCFYLTGQGWLFSGDTLFQQPGATGRSFSDFGTIIDSIRDRLLVLDPDTIVHTGHGPDTAVGTNGPTCRNRSPAGTDRRRADRADRPARSWRDTALQSSSMMLAWGRA